MNKNTPILTVEISQKQAELKLSQLFQDDKTLEEFFPQYEIQVKIRPDFIREKILLIRFLREASQKALAGELATNEGIITLAGAKAFVEKYFKL